MNQPGTTWCVVWKDNGDWELKADHYATLKEAKARYEKIRVGNTAYLCRVLEVDE